MDFLINNFDKLGLKNAALYLYDKPVRCGLKINEKLPDIIYLRCVVKNNELYIISKERQNCSIENIYNRSELPREKMGYISYPIFCNNYLFGILVCGVSRGMIDAGEFISFQLGRSVYLNWPFTE